MAGAVTTHNGHAFVDQGDVDREFAAAAQEFFGPVDGIHQPECAANDLFFKTLRDGLFADCRNTGQQVAEGWQYERFGALVGFRHWRSIVLVPDFEICRIHIENRPARSAISVAAFIRR